MGCRNIYEINEVPRIKRGTKGPMAYLIGGVEVLSQPTDSGLISRLSEFTRLVKKNPLAGEVRVREFSKSGFSSLLLILMALVERGHLVPVGKGI
jgi:hypothetical protein